MNWNIYIQKSTPDTQIKNMAQFDLSRLLLTSKYFVLLWCNVLLFFTLIPYMYFKKSNREQNIT